MVAKGRDGIHAFPVDFYSWDQPDSRWILGLQWMAKTLHPDVFAGWDTRAFAAEFFHRIYGMDSDRVREIIFDRLQGDLD